MTANGGNVHATAIVVGTTGLLFVGPSGCGKSALVLACLASAHRSGQFSALVGDDQVFIALHNGRVVARRPETIAGLIEIRGAGIAGVDSLSAAVMHHAVRPVDLATADRLPAEHEQYQVVDGARLPLVRLPATSPDPLAALAALIPALRF